MCTRGCVIVFILVEMVWRPVFLGVDMVRTWSETGCGGHLFTELVTAATSVSRHLHGWRLCEHVSSFVRVLSVCSIRYLITELLQFASQREPELPNPCYSRFPLCLMVFCFLKRTLLRLTIPQIDNCTCRCRFLRSEMFL
jgi:hypothetical protein